MSDSVRCGIHLMMLMEDVASCMQSLEGSFEGLGNQ